MSVKKEVKIEYTAFSSADELDKTDRELVGEAIAAMKNAYASYSGFKVGAAVRLSDGRIFLGSNQENSAYPSGLCAERVALFAAHNDLRGAYITDMAVTGGKDGVLSQQSVFSCGACAQVLLEFETAGHPVNILFAGSQRILKLSGAASLLPFAFQKSV